MKQTNILIATFILAIGFCSSHVFAARNIDAAEFVDEASAKGVAEIETAKLALEKGSAKTREFAQQMIEDHGEANNRLAELARASNLKVSDEAGIMDKAKTMMLNVREGTFDKAYATNRVEAHRDTIELFQRAANSNLGELSAFAKETLPKLEKHLEMAQELERSTPQ
ncbi:DUF4142 domain-containing protein [Nitrosomonas sp. Nm166]|uniref:DUF4142 domain-containing protein n=1 Tax=Nitrosomonas sp. Nm166 TaxID=1881054 RepID=UPI0008EEE8B1|nr:DUF4142 domain-containing protein [Nitrosomonas sp. Nm166]SFE65851.1 putative membrane protein [Nitrosomonas sp. Nm166]